MVSDILVLIEFNEINGFGFSETELFQSRINYNLGYSRSLWNRELKFTQLMNKRNL